MSSGYLSLFQNKHFMCLWSAQILSQLADRVVFVLFVAVLTAQQNIQAEMGHAATGAALMTSWLYVAFTIPAIILSPVAGVYIDRWSNRAVLVLSNVLRGIFVCMIAMPTVMQYPVFSFGLAALISIGSQFFGPAETAAIPRLVRREDLYWANSLFFTTMMIALGFGFAAGEPIISYVGVENAPWAVAGLFFVAAILLMFVKDSKQSSGPRDIWFDELKFGLRYIWEHKPVFKAILKITILFSTIITLNIIAVALSQQVLHIEARKFGYIVAAAGLGMILGNFWVAHRAQKLPSDILAYEGFTGLGFYLTLLGSLGFISGSLFPSMGFPSFSWQGPLMSIPLLITVLVGASCAMVAVPTQAALQAVVPEDLRGKVFGAQNTAMSAASTIPVVLAGASSDNLPGGVSTTLFLIGIPMCLAGFWFLRRAIFAHRV
jgi:MFS family permease